VDVDAPDLPAVLPNALRVDGDDDALTAEAFGCPADEIRVASTGRSDTLASIHLPAGAAGP